MQQPTPSVLTQHSQCHGGGVWQRAVRLWNWMVQEAGCGLGYAKQAEAVLGVQGG